jgi:hypothetical protein
MIQWKIFKDKELRKIKFIWQYDKSLVMKIKLEIMLFCYKAYQDKCVSEASL